MTDAQEMADYLAADIFWGADSIVSSVLKGRSRDDEFSEDLRRRHRLMGAVFRVRLALGDAATPFQARALQLTFEWFTASISDLGEPDDQDDAGVMSTDLTLTDF